MDEHALLCAVKDLALELGRSPLRSEFIAAGKGHQFGLERHFRSYSLLLQAAGLETYNDRRASGKQKINGSIFERDLESHLKSNPPPQIQDRKPWPKIAILPDVHFPWENQVVLEAFYSFISIHDPEYVIQIGDLYDMYSHAKFPRSHNVFLPKEESAISRKSAETMWDRIRSLVPNAKLMQCVGNHDLRALKRVLEVYPSAETWIQEAVEKMMTFPGVETIFDPRQEIIIEDIAIFHGYRSQLGQHRDYTLMNCIVGHQHVGGVVFRHHQGRILWELNAGFAGNPEGKGLTYTPQRITKWTSGFGYVDSYGPRFIPIGG